jgi:hypothetical protein
MSKATRAMAMTSAREQHQAFLEAVSDVRGHVVSVRAAHPTFAKRLAGTEDILESLESELEDELVDEEKYPYDDPRKEHMRDDDKD